ncbi:hypothetical protein C8Q80DRAFT_1221996 [Daedaleopsis nitida]|nr:hypothetical protein C8Q80DRAFT_1221996 [Daedaleopsis nitida]
MERATISQVSNYQDPWTSSGLWIGKVPPRLQGLSWTEKMLISRIKHTFCIVKFHVCGMSKMKANVVSHSLRMPKIHQALPPAREELDDVLAFIIYSEDEPPVIVNYTQRMGSNKDSESTAVNNTEEDEGVEQGDCPFLVCGLPGTALADLADVRPYKITARAVKHSKSNGKALDIGQAKQPEITKARQHLRNIKSNRF